MRQKKVLKVHGIMKHTHDTHNKHTRGQDGGKDQTQITKAHVQVNKSRTEGWCSERGKKLGGIRKR